MQQQDFQKCTMTPQQIEANIAWNHHFQEETRQDQLRQYDRQQTLEAQKQQVEHAADVQQAHMHHVEYLASAFTNDFLFFLVAAVITRGLKYAFEASKVKAALPRYYCVIKNPDGSHTFASQQQFEAWNPPSDDLPPSAGLPNANM